MCFEQNRDHAHSAKTPLNIERYVAMFEQAVQAGYAIAPPFFRCTKGHLDPHANNQRRWPTGRLRKRGAPQVRRSSP